MCYAWHGIVLSPHPFPKLTTIRFISKCISLITMTTVTHEYITKYSNMCVLKSWDDNRTRTTPRWAAMRVKAHLLGHLLPVPFCYNKCITRKCLKITEYNIHSCANQWRISTSVKVIWRISVMVLTISEILMFQIRYRENLGQGHGL